MIQSMTGYGKCVVEYKGKKIHAEVKSLNSKAMDLTTRVSPIYREKEMEIRQLLQQRLERGKVDFVIWMEKDAAATASTINIDIVTEYKKQIENMQEVLGLPAPSDWYSTLMRMPDVMAHADMEELTDEEWQVARNAAESAIDELIAFRKQEGLALSNKFREKIANIEKCMHAIEPFEKDRTEKIRQRILDALEQRLGVDYDKNRLEQEMIYYIEKLDINEERVRLRQHCAYYLETLENEPYPGRKLGFIAQEMGREINTTGSKANHAGIQKVVVRMKDELEKIREQSMNIL